MSLFGERFVLAVFAGVFVANFLTNPLKFDFWIRVGFGIVLVGAALMTGRAMEIARSDKEAKKELKQPSAAAPSTTPSIQPVAQPPQPESKPEDHRPPNEERAHTAKPHDDKRDERSQTKNVVVHNNGTVIQVGRDATFNLKSGPPSDQELQGDFEISRIPVKLEGPEIAPHWVAFQVKALQYDHPKVYIRVKATAPLNWKFIPRTPDGMRSMIARCIDGNIFEYTEGPPGMLRGEAFQFVLFADKPFDIADVHVENKNPFNEIDGRWKRVEERMTPKPPSSAEPSE